MVITQGCDMYKNHTYILQHNKAYIKMFMSLNTSEEEVF